MTPQQIVQFFERLAWHEGDLRGARVLLAGGFVDHDALPFEGRLPGREGLLQVVSMLRTGLPDLRRDVDIDLALGNHVVTSVTYTGKHLGPLFGVPASGQRVAVRGINLYTVRGDLITELRHSENMLDLLRQLGAIPAGAANSARPSGT